MFVFKKKIVEFARTFKSGFRPSFGKVFAVFDIGQRINEMLVENVMIETEKRYGTKIKIEHQKKHLVTVIMRHVYFKNVRNMYSAQEEVDMLNKEVIRQMLPVVIRELIAYLRYIRDYNSIIPMERPRPDNRRTGNLMPFAKMFDFDNSRDIL